MTSRMMACARCGGVQWQDMIDVRTSADPHPVLLPGRWEACERCGWTGEPFTPPRPAPSMGPVQGPSVPSPLEMLAGAFDSPADDDPYWDDW